MSVYVDEVRDYNGVDNPATRKYGYAWCHMVSRQHWPDHPLAYLLPRIAAKGRPDARTGCWLWTGSKKTRGGYGELRVNGKLQEVTRIMAAIFLGLNIADRKTFACHTCDTPECFNPAHLFLGTLKDNEADKDAKGRRPRGAASNKTHLTNGDVAEIRRLREAGMTCQSIGDQFGICRQAVSRIARGKRWLSM